MRKIVIDFFFFLGERPRCLGSGEGENWGFDFDLTMEECLCLCLFSLCTNDRWNESSREKVVGGHQIYYLRATMASGLLYVW